MQGGRLQATGEPAELAERFPEEERENWGHVAVLPGTVNGHGHTFQALLRGFGDDLGFMAWRDFVLYPFSERLDGEGIKTGALFDFAEMAKAGITTAVDFFYLHDRGNENDLAVVEAAREVGIRVVLARSMYDWIGAPRRYQETPAEAERHFRDLHAALRGERRAFAQPAPHSIHAASPDMIRSGAKLAAEFDVPFHIHVAEGRYEHDQSMEQHGLSPVAYLDSLGVLSHRTVMVHCVWVDEADLAIMRDRGVRVVHNPSANAVRGGEILGGLPLGRIAADYAADLVVVDLEALSMQPAVTAAKQVVYSMQPEAIRRVIVGGETIMENGRLTRVDEREIAAKARQLTATWEPVSRNEVARSH